MEALDVCTSGAAAAYDKLDRVEEGRIEVQAQTAWHWLEHKHIRIKRI
jgi:hypothetical protein